MVLRSDQKDDNEETFSCEFRASLCEKFRMRFLLLIAAFAVALLLPGCLEPSAGTSYLPVREQVEERPASIPTPTPQTPIYRPLDPAGQPR